MKETLALALRPKTLDELIGCNSIVKRIRARIASGRLPKAWMLIGQTGCGKTTTSRILASALQCYHNVKFGTCTKCYRRQHRFDIVELNMPNVSVADLREILDGAYYNPKPGSKYRIYILDEAQRMSDASHQLMLKFTEDCPATTKWITNTTDPDKLPRALRRRHKIYAFPPLEIEDIRKVVKVGLKAVHSDLEYSELVEKLMEKGVTSPALILNAVENYVEGASAEEASEVESVSTIDTLGLSIAVCKGQWEDAVKILQRAKPEDAGAISASVRGYLKGILLGEQENSKRADLSAESIIKLMGARDDISAVTATLFKVCKHFSRNGAS